MGLVGGKYSGDKFAHISCGQWFKPYFKPGPHLKRRESPALCGSRRMNHDVRPHREEGSGDGAIHIVIELVKMHLGMLVRLLCLSTRFTFTIQIMSSVLCKKSRQLKSLKNLRNTGTDLRLSNKRSNNGQRCFSYRCAKLWNCLSAEAKQADSLDSLKKTF